MVSYDEGYQGDQNISLESLNIELSSDFEYTCETSSSPSLPLEEVDKVVMNVGSSVMVFEVDNDEEDSSVTDVDSDSISSNDVPLVASISRDSRPRLPNQTFTTPHSITPSPSPKSEVITPDPRTPPPRRARMRVQPSLSPESDGESDESSYVPPTRTKKPVTRRNVETSPTRTGKKSSPVRGGEPRRQQNMVAQKKYRDKKVHGAHLMSGCIVELRKLVLAPLKAKSFQNRVKELLEQFSGDLRDLDENLWAKQDLAVREIGMNAKDE